MIVYVVHYLKTCDDGFLQSEVALVTKNKETAEKRRIELYEEKGPFTYIGLEEIEIE